MRLAQNKSARVPHLSYLKAFLVIGMIFVHSLTFVPGDWGDYTKLYVFFTLSLTLVSFSGFVFSFGATYAASHSSKDPKVLRSRFLKSSLKLYLCYFISGFLLRTVARNVQPSFQSVTDIALLKDIPEFSDFLLFFAAASFLLAFTGNFVDKIMKNSTTTVAAISLALLSTKIPTSTIPKGFLSLYVGSTSYSAFPVLPYSSLFFLGYYFEKRKVKLSIPFLILSLVFSIFFFIDWALTGHMASRFPVSATWILSGITYIYLYYLMSYYAAPRWPQWLREELIGIGQNTLFYLLMSSLLLFSIDGLFHGEKVSGLLSISAGFTCLLLCRFYLSLIKN